MAGIPPPLTCNLDVKLIFSFLPSCGSGTCARQPPPGPGCEPGSQPTPLILAFRFYFLECQCSCCLPFK